MIVPLDLGYVNYYSTQPQNPETPVMFKVALNQYQGNIYFLYTLKTSDNLWFPDIFKG